MILVPSGDRVDRQQVGASIAVPLPVARCSSATSEPSTQPLLGPWRDVPPPLFFPLGGPSLGLRPQPSAQAALLRIADIDIMRGAGTATTGQAAWLRQ